MEMSRFSVTEVFLLSQCTKKNQFRQKPLQNLKDFPWPVLRSILGEFFYASVTSFYFHILSWHVS